MHKGIVYKCLLCENVVRKAKKNLLTHIKTIHEIQEPKNTIHFIRETVSKNEDSKEDLKKYACLICDTKLKTRIGRNKHMRELHKNACRFCGSIFETAQQKTKHISGNF